jgi:hypothetical protein
VLTALGRPATVTATAPRSATTLHLTRLLVAVSERHAISAELALGIDDHDDHDDHDVDTHQDTYDTTTVRAMFERDTMLHAAGANDDENDDPSGMAEMWNLAAHTTIAADAILAALAQLVTPPADDTTAAVNRLDAATALLVHVGDLCVQESAEPVAALPDWR